MALTQSSREMTDQLQIQSDSPERTRIWTEPNSKLNPNTSGVKRCVVVPVIYYLSRNGQLEHPHFMEVPLSSSQGLFLRDVINRFNFLRGKGMANHYSWSAKRSYKNGYVWHDLEGNDFIHPVHSHEYILKGSEILEASSTSPNQISDSTETPISSTSGKPLETTTAKADAADDEFPVRNQSWSSINVHENKVYKTSFSGELAGNCAAADASTQTDEKRHRRRQSIKECEIVEEEEGEEEPVKLQEEEHQQQTTELSRAEISPPPSDSSPETLESLMKAVGNLAPLSSSRRTEGDHRLLPGGGKMKRSSILASLISCGSISFRDGGAAAGSGKDHGFSLISHYRARLPRGGNRAVEEVESVSSVPTSGSFAKMGMDEKEYFSGSLLETRNHDFASLKRSSSYNADRRSQLRVEEREMDGVRGKCIPRKQKATYPRPPKTDWSDEMANKGSN